MKNVTVRQSIAFGVHLANAHDFIVENITLEEHRRDGVHVNGPASDGLIRGVRGDSKDDDVALNAWEWKNYAYPATVPSSTSSSKTSPAGPGTTTTATSPSASSPV